MADDSIDQNLGISRRDLIKRGAIVGGTLMWAAPVIQSVSSPAFGAARSVPQHTCCSCKKPAPTSANICAVDHFTCASCQTFCGSASNVFEFRTGTGCACIPNRKGVPRCQPVTGETCDVQPC